jgi:PAS domain S-box-containing protein
LRIVALLVLFAVLQVGTAAPEVRRVLASAAESEDRPSLISRGNRMVTGFSTALQRRQQQRLETRAPAKVAQSTRELSQVRQDGLSPSLATRVHQAAVVLVPLLALLAAGVVWTWLLRREVAQRTQALRASESQFRSLVEGAPDAVFVQTGGRFAYLNEAACELFGAARPEELLGQPVMDRFHPSVHGLVRDRIESLNIHKQRVPAIEEVYLKLDGTEVPTEVSAVPIRYANGDGALVFVRDITERKLAEQRIDHLNTVLRAVRDINHLIVREHQSDRLIAQGCRILVDHRGYLSAVIIITDEAGRPTEWAEAGIEGKALTSLSEKLENGELPPCCSRTPAEDGIAIVDDRKAVCAMNLPVAHDHAGSLAICAHLVHAEAPVGFLIVSVEPKLFAASGERELLAELADDLAYALSGIRRIDAHRRSEEERKALERQLSQAQKMEAIGRLAGGVAHDFNNNLTVILGYTKMALLRISRSDDPLHKRLTEIQRAATRSVELTRQLLAFARQQTVTPRVLDPNETIDAMLGMLRRLIGEEIDLVWTPGDQIWPVRIDPVQVDQILANLIVNARDAIDEVGAVTIETSNVTIDAAFSEDIDGLEPGEYVVLTVSDTGSGMDRTTLESVFEPFFTTKPMGKGTGLGLATVYGIVKQNDGFVTVDSTPELGTTFRIYLPRAGHVEAQKATSSGVRTRGHESILVVEDEPQLLELTSELLEGLGYIVWRAASPTQALWLARQHSDDLQLLLTDVVMPEMNGRELWQKLDAICPDLRCLFMSGYTADVIADRGIVEEGMHFIQKPFTEQALAAAVRAALQEYLS